MKRLLFTAVFFIFLAACGTAPQISGSASNKFYTSQSKIAIASDNILADAIAGELLSQGVTIVERNRLFFIIAEQSLVMSGLTEDIKLVKAGKILNVDALLFVKMHSSPEIPGRVESAVVKIINVNNGEVMAAISYQNGRDGVPGSWADADEKEPLTMTAKRIANKIFSKQ